MTTIGHAARSGGGRAVGILFMLLAALFFSTGGLITRHIEVANGWQVMFYRAVGMAAVLAVILAVKERGRVVAPFRAMGLASKPYRSSTSRSGMLRTWSASSEIFIF